MSIMDSLNVAPTNIGSFAQKRQMRANPIMRGRPNMAKGMRAQNRPQQLPAPRPSQLPAPPAQMGSGLAPMRTPYDMQQMQPMQNPMQQAQEQMRGYTGPDLGSRDPREIARMSQGIGPSPQMMQMDQNGLELRRGPR